MFSSFFDLFQHLTPVVQDASSLRFVYNVITYQKQCHVGKTADMLKGAWVQGVRGRRSGDAMKIPATSCPP